MEISSVEIKTAWEFIFLKTEINTKGSSKMDSLKDKVSTLSSTETSILDSS